MTGRQDSHAPLPPPVPRPLPAADVTVLATRGASDTPQLHEGKTTDEEPDGKNAGLYRGNGRSRFPLTSPHTGPTTRRQLPAWPIGSRLSARLGSARFGSVRRGMAWYFTTLVSPGLWSLLVSGLSWSPVLPSFAPGMSPCASHPGSSFLRSAVPRPARSPGQSRAP